MVGTYIGELRSRTFLVTRCSVLCSRIFWSRALCLFADKEGVDGWPQLFSFQIWCRGCELAMGVEYVESMHEEA